MIIQLILFILGALTAIGILLRIFKKDWLSGYVRTIARLLAFPFIALIMVLYLAAILFRLLLHLSWLLLRVTVKSIVFAIIAAPSAIIILITYFVPNIGGVIQRLKGQIGQFVPNFGIIDECQHARQMMVRIIAEQDNRSPQYDSENRYREELQRVKFAGKERLAVGESALTLSIGGILLVSQAYGLLLFQRVFFGLTAAHLIQAVLFVIAISIIYRVSILDFLAYNGDEEFKTIDEMDVALSYQNAVAYVGFIQILTFILVIGMRLSNADRETIRAVLDFQYGGKSHLESMKFAWNRLINEKT